MNIRQVGENGDHPCTFDVPTWDEARGELRWGEQLIKRFCQPARHQRTVLGAFQNDGWPVRIDDPLTGGAVDSHVRLGDTVRRLNIQRWKLRQPAENDLPVVGGLW